jgi:hypothetical protein
MMMVVMVVMVKRREQLSDYLVVHVREVVSMVIYRPGAMHRWTGDVLHVPR